MSNNDSVIDSYKQKRKLQMWVTIPLVLSIFILPQVAPNLVDANGWIIVLPVAAALAFSFYNWRCPACKAYLGRSWNPKHCQHCGIELR
jgi:hypothetical protein